MEPPADLGTDAKGIALVTAVMQALVDFGFDTSGGFVTKFEAVAQSVGLADNAGSPPTPNQVAAAWHQFLDCDDKLPPQEKNTPEMICLLASILTLASSGHPGLAGAFRNEFMNLNRSRLEMAMRLGSRLYMLGRTRTLFADDPELCRRLLEAAIAYLTQAINDGSQLPDRARARLYGMRGAARVLLSRTEADVPELEDAAADLELSRQLGNATHENWEYRREALLRLTYCDPTPERIGMVAPLFEEVGRRDRQFYFDLANYRSHCATSLDNKAQSFLQAVEDAISAASVGLSLPGDTQVPDGMLRAARGFAHMLRSQHLRATDTVAAALALDEAIDDLRGAADGQFGGGTLARCLLIKAQRLRYEDPLAAMDTLRDALDCVALARPEQAESLSEQVDGALAECALRLAIDAENWEEVVAYCQSLIHSENQIEHHAITLALALRLLLDPKQGLNAATVASARRMATQIIAQFCEMAYELPDDVNYSKMFLQQVAGLSYRLDDGTPSQRSLELYRLLLEREIPPGPITLGYYGHIALQIAKRTFKEGRPDEGSALLDDAILSLDAAREAFEVLGEPVPGFHEVVCHSKLGEAYLRKRGVAAVDKAIVHLEEARRLGNETPELHGLLGDGYYRRGYATGSVPDLFTAISHKAAAREAGHESREGASVVGRIHAKLFEQTGALQHLQLSLKAVLEAHRLAPDWPWPLFQLAELSTVLDAHPDPLAGVPVDSVPASLSSLLTTGDRTGLLQLGIRLAVDTDEFRRRGLGGRTGVFVLEDPHRLLSTTMVLKPTTTTDAKREMAAAREFSKHLHDKRLRHFELPTPIGIVETGGAECVYAMQRAIAEPLSTLIVGPDRKGYAQAGEELARSVDFLAEFHRWAGIMLPDPEPRRFLAEQLRKALSQLGADGSTSARARRAFEALIAAELPLVRKKDAHAENWMVTRSGRIVMIDLESSRPLPIGYEVVQLLDDYPGYRFDDEGWRTRLGLTERYWKAATGTSPRREQMTNAYLASLAHRCALGAARIRSKSRSVTSSSALRSMSLRYTHYRAGIAHLSTSKSSDARDLGNLLGRLIP